MYFIECLRVDLGNSLGVWSNPSLDVTVCLYTARFSIPKQLYCFFILAV